MSNTFSEILYQRGPEVKHRGRFVPLEEWQIMKRIERYVQDREAGAIRERILEAATVIASALAFCWIVLPGLWNIWRG